MKKKAVHEPVRDTIPDANPPDFPVEEAATGQSIIDSLLSETTTWYQRVCIKKKLPPETEAFRIKLFNILKNDFLKTASEQMQKNKQCRGKLAQNFRFRIMAYLDMLKRPQYQELIDASLNDKMSRIFSDGDWTNEEGIRKMLVQLRPLLISSFEQD